MKDYIYILLFIASSNIYGQTAIVNDAMFIKYEEEYLKMCKSAAVNDYELTNRKFNSKFNDYKQREKFRKSNDKERWLTKNYKKTTFGSVNEAINVYRNLVHSKELVDQSNNIVQEVHNELLKKYDETLIWETLKTRLKAKMKNKKEEL